MSCFQEAPQIVILTATRYYDWTPFSREDESADDNM